ncbi:MAG: transposase [bacterium]
MEPKGWYRRYLPHCDQPGAVQFVTFCLADAWGTREPEQWYVMTEKERFQWREEALDRAYGSCALGQAAIAGALAAMIQKRDPDEYALHGWVIMPNHVHLLIQVTSGQPLHRVIGKLKGESGFHANRLLGLRKQFWGHGFWDRYIRDERHFDAALHYTEWNPVRGGLCQKPEDWPSGSAAVRHALQTANKSRAPMGREFL